MSPNGVSTMSPDKTLDRAIQYPRSVFTGSPIEIGCFRFRSFNSAEVGQARLRVKPGNDSGVGVNLIVKNASLIAEVGQARLRCALLQDEVANFSQPSRW